LTTCNTCWGDKTNLSKIKDFYKNSNKCVEICPDRKFVNGKICDNCHTTCKTCTVSNANTACTSCSFGEGRYLNSSGECIAEATCETINKTGKL